MLVLQKHGVSCRRFPNQTLEVGALGLWIAFGGRMGSYCIARALIIVREKHLPVIERVDWDLVGRLAVRAREAAVTVDTASRSWPLMKEGTYTGVWIVSWK